MERIWINLFYLILASPAILQIIFLILIITNIVNWPWWIVIAPIWAPILLVFATIAIAGLIIFIKLLFNLK